MVPLVQLPLTANGKIDRAALSHTPAAPFAAMLPPLRRDRSLGSHGGEGQQGGGGGGVLTHLEGLVAGSWRWALGFDGGRADGGRGPGGEGEGMGGGVRRGGGGAGDGKAALGPGAHWFELGGDSILAVKMLGALDRALQEAQLLPNAASSSTASTPADRARVWMCGLHRKPRLRDFTHFVQWSLVTSYTPRRLACRMAERWDCPRG
jgi:hypothetical protein